MFLYEISFKDKGFIFSVADNCFEAGNFCHHFLFGRVKTGAGSEVGAYAGTE